MEKSNGDLRDMIHALPKLPPHTTLSESGCGVIEFNLKTGKAIAACLFENKYINITRVKSEKGTIFDKHAHKSVYEHILIESGKAELTLCDTGEKLILKENKPFTLKPNELHLMLMLTDTVIIAITEPPDPDFPHLA